MNSIKMGEAYQAGEYFMGMDKGDLEAFLIQFLNEEPEVFLNQVSRFQGKDRQTNDQESERLKMVIRLCEEVINESHGGGYVNKTIPLIKKYREFTGAGLKEAKDWVEENVEHRHSMKALRDEIEEAQRSLRALGIWYSPSK